MFICIQPHEYRFAITILRVCNALLLKTRISITLYLYLQIYFTIERVIRKREHVQLFEISKYLRTCIFLPITSLFQVKTKHFHVFVYIVTACAFFSDCFKKGTSSDGKFSFLSFLKNFNFWTYVTFSKQPVQLVVASCGELHVLLCVHNS